MKTILVALLPLNLYYIRNNCHPLAAQWQSFSLLRAALLFPLTSLPLPPRGAHNPEPWSSNAKPNKLMAWKGLPRYVPLNKRRNQTQALLHPLCHETAKGSWKWCKPRQERTGTSFSIQEGPALSIPPRVFLCIPWIHLKDQRCVTSSWGLLMCFFKTFYNDRNFKAEEETLKERPRRKQRSTSRPNWLGNKMYIKAGKKVTGSNILDLAVQGQ